MNITIPLRLKQRFARSALLQLIVVMVLLIAVLVWLALLWPQIKHELVLHDLGLAMSLVIIAIFFLGMLRLAALFRRYSQEEVALLQYVRSVRLRQPRQAMEIGGDYLITHRLLAYETMQDQGESVNQAALAAVNQALESERLSFTRYVHGILILLGVLGTVASLAIALFASAQLMSNAQSVGQSMDLVIKGMSSALTTTVLAILCYLPFSYFYRRLVDLQNGLLADLEYVTTVAISVLLPGKMTSSAIESVATTQLLEHFRTIAALAEKTQKALDNVVNKAEALVESAQRQPEPPIFTREDYDLLVTYIRSGFRLSEVDLRTDKIISHNSLVD